MLNLQNSKSRNYSGQRRTVYVLLFFTFIFFGHLAAGTVQSAQLEDIVNIDLRTDVRLFTVMAALNVAGFDYEAPGQQMSEVRSQVRKQLQNLDSQLVKRLQDFYAGHQGSDIVETQATYTSFALLLSGPPQFELSLEPEHMPAGTAALVGFEDLVSEFYQAAEINSLWGFFQRSHGEELIAYRPVLLNVIRETLDYLRMPPRVVLDRRIVLISDLLNYRNVVNARNLQKVYYLIVGPTIDPATNYVQLQHEYLHFILDPLINKYGPEVITDEKIVEIVNKQPELVEQYRDRMSVIATESLIEALQLRLHSDEDPQQALVGYFRQGLVLTPYFYEHLSRFEKEGEERFGSFLDQILDDLSSGRVEDDAEEIARIELEIEQQRTANREKEQAREQAEIEGKISRLLNEAGKLTAEQQIAQARAKLDELRQLDPENARADFYRGQIANQEGDFETAYQYYKRAARTSDTEIWVKAWSTVRVGRYLASQGQFPEARAHFEEVLRLEGELQGAREVAEESLALLPD